MRIKTFTFNPFSTNCFVCDDEGEAVVVDPSCATDAECATVLSYIESERLQVREVLLTHAHIDHIFGCAPICDALGVGLRVHEDEVELLAHAEYQGQMFGVQIETPPDPAGFLKPGEPVIVGGARWDVLHTPGHSPGSVSFHDRPNGFVISGDVLFSGSVGRTDLWQGSMPILMRSIADVLMPMDDATRVLSGHGPETTIGRERETNPFRQEWGSRVQ